MPDTLTLNQWELIQRLQNGQCAHPDCEETELEMDHIIPISDDECPGTVIENIQGLCRSHNASKNNQIIDYRPISVEVI